MRYVKLDTEAVSTLAAAKGIDTNSELARRCSISSQHIGRVLDGKRPALPSLVLTLAKVLEVKPSTLLDDSEAALGAAMDAEIAAEVAAS